LKRDDHEQRSGKFLSSAVGGAGIRRCAVELKTEKDKLIIASARYGTSIKRNGIDVDPNIVSQASRTSCRGEALMTEQEMRDSINALQKEMRQSSRSG